MTTKRTTLLLLCFLLSAEWDGFTVAPVGAQQDEPGDDDTIGTDPDTQEMPIDGGLVVLLAAGAAYGLRKYRTGIQQRKLDGSTSKA